MSAPIKYGMLRRSRNVEDAIADFDLPIELRLWLLATARANANGHAIFKQGEIAELLPRINKTTGEIGSYAAAYLRQAMNRLIRPGLLAPVSRLPANGPACLVMPTEVYEYGGNQRSAACAVHRHKLLWKGHGWFDPDDFPELSVRVA